MSADDPGALVIRDLWHALRHEEFWCSEPCVGNGLQRSKDDPHGILPFGIQ